MEFGIFINISIFSSQIVVYELDRMKLPVSPLMLENSLFIRQEDDILAWPLICDPTSRIVDWVRNYLQHKHVMIVRYSVSCRTEILIN